MTTKPTWLDRGVAVWAVAACGAFIAAVLPGAGQSAELELVGRCVYLVVIAAAVVGVALRAIGKMRR